MRAKPSRERKGKQQCWAGNAECGAEAAMFGTLGLAAALAIVLAIISGSLPAKSGPQLLSAGQRSSIAKYLGSGQLVADARTLASIAHYIMEPESRSMTIIEPEGPTLSNTCELCRRKGTSFPTNNPTGAPKA